MCVAGSDQSPSSSGQAAFGSAASASGKGLIFGQAAAAAAAASSTSGVGAFACPNFT